MTVPRTRRDVLVAAGVTIGSVALAGCSSLVDNSGGTPAGSETETSTPTATTTDVDTGSSDESGEGPAASSLPVADTESEYAVLGSADAAETATLYGGWKCPYTAEFVNTMLPDIIDRYMEPGDLAVEFRAVRFQADESWGDDEPRSNRAGQAVWHETPEQFPAYVETLFSNQPSGRTEWATVEKLVSLAEKAGIEETGPIEQSVTAGDYTARWKATMDVVAEKGIEGIPRFELGAEITAPILDPEATEAQLKQALE